MSTLSGLFPVASTSPIKSIQTGFLSSAIIQGSAGGEDGGYINITISAVSAIAKCEVFFMGGFGFGSVSTVEVMGKSGNTNAYAYDVTARLTSTTNLRISIPSDYPVTNGRIAGRWTVVEFN